MRCAEASRPPSVLWCAPVMRPARCLPVDHNFEPPIVGHVTTRTTLPARVNLVQPLGVPHSANDGAWATPCVLLRSGFCHPSPTRCGSGVRWQRPGRISRGTLCTCLWHLPVNTIRTSIGSLRVFVVQRPHDTHHEKT